jgi:hypothetical protein
MTHHNLVAFFKFKYCTEKVHTEQYSVQYPYAKFLMKTKIAFV